MDTELVIVGVLARIDTGAAAAVRRRINALEGVETFDLPEPEQLGILIEADSLDAAHDRLRCEVDETEGVLGTWPVALETDDEACGAGEQRAEASDAVSATATATRPAAAHAPFPTDSSQRSSR